MQEVNCELRHPTRLGTCLALTLAVSIAAVSASALETPQPKTWEPPGQANVRRIQSLFMEKKHEEAEREILASLKASTDAIFDLALASWYERLPESDLSSGIDESVAKDVRVTFSSEEDLEGKRVSFAVSGDFPAGLEEVELKMKRMKLPLVSLDRDCPSLRGKYGPLECRAKSMTQFYPGPGLYTIIIRSRSGTQSRDFVLPVSSVRPYGPKILQPKSQASSIDPEIPFHVTNLVNYGRSIPELKLTLSRKGFDVPITESKLNPENFEAAGAITSPARGPVTLTLSWQQDLRRRPVAFRQQGRISYPLNVKE